MRRQTTAASLSLDEQKKANKRTPLSTISKMLGHDLVNELAWSCPEADLVQLFKRNVSRNHLEVGVEGGYSLVKRLKSHAGLTVSFLDSDKDSLREAHRNAKHLSPHLYCAGLLQEWNFKNRKFDSINLNMVIQSLPGRFEDRLSTLLHNARLCLAPRGKIFGSTILGKGENGKIASMLIDMYNKKGVLNNKRDNMSDLQTVLNYYFTNVKVTQVGCVALFEASMKAGKREGYSQLVPFNLRRERSDIRELPVYNIDKSRQKEVRMERRFAI